MGGHVVTPARSLIPGFGWHPLVDLLAGGAVWDVLLRAAAHVELVDLGQELLGLWRVCGGGVVCHTVQPAMPGERTRRGESVTYDISFK